MPLTAAAVEMRRSQVPLQAAPQLGAAARPLLLAVLLLAPALLLAAVLLLAAAPLLAAARWTLELREL